jgi:hypothetical protein
MDQQDRLMRAYSRLLGVRKSIEDPVNVNFDERHVRELHDALDHLTALGIDVDEWRVRDETITVGGVDRALLQARVVGVLAYFTLITPHGDGNEQKLTLSFKR